MGSRARQASRGQGRRRPRRSGPDSARRIARPRARETSGAPPRGVRLERRVDRGDRRRGDAEPLAQAHRVAVEGLELEPLAAAEVLVERREIPWRDGGRCLHGLVHDAGREPGLRRGGQGDAPHHMTGAQDFVDRVLVVDAILEGEDGRVGSDDGADALGGRLGVERLHAEEDDLGRGEATNVLDGREADDGLALDGRADAQAVALDRRQMLAPCDQRDRLAAARELRAEVAADAARAHDDDVHGMMIHCAKNMSASLERRVAIDAARAAGHLLQSELQGSRHIAYKGSPTNLVTEMDARAEELIVARLLSAFPEDGILAEERGARCGRSGRRWIIDPLDGTTNYAHGLPIFGVSIGLEADRQMQVGVVFDPNRDELFVAERGRGATVNGQPLAVSPTAMLGESLLATGFPYNVRETADNNLREYAAFTVRTRGVRRMGSAVLYLAWLAAGRLDGYWEPRLGPWGAGAARLAGGGA